MVSVREARAVPLPVHHALKPWCFQANWNASNIYEGAIQIVKGKQSANSPM